MADGALSEVTYDAAGDKLIVRTIYAQALEDYPHVMGAVIDKFIELKRIPRLIITAEAREYEYSFDEAKLLFEIANAIMRIRAEEIISLSNVLASPACDVILPGKFGLVQKIVSDLRYDPVLAYKELLHEIRFLRLKIHKLHSGEDISDMALAPKELCVECFEHYMNKTLSPIRAILEECKLLRDARTVHARGRDYYRRIFHPSTRPTFMYTRFSVTPPPGAELVERYMVGDAQVEIFKLPDSVRKLYHVTPPEFRLHDEEYAILEQARRTLGAHEPSVAEVTEPQRFRENIGSIALDLVREITSVSGRTMPESQMKKLANIIARYTAGLGVLEVLLADDKIQDILINSPIGEVPIYLMHGDHLECITNVTPSAEDGESWATRFRMQSGRPLDEANPVLDTELMVPGGRARVAAIAKPLSPDGLAFAFRRHRDKPWTFPLFIRSKMIDSFSAGLLWFLIDGSRTMLIAGTRGSGKSSFLGACMVQIMPKIRIITTEDSVGADCRLLLRNEGKVWRENIGKLVDSTIEKHGCRIGSAGHEISQNFDGIEVCALRNGKIGWVPIKSLIRHKVDKDILTIRTRTGREIKVTGDHSLFGLDENGEIVPVKAGEFSRGSYLAVPRRLPENQSGVDKINLLEHLDKFDGLFVAGEELKAIIKEKWNDIKTLAKKGGWSKNAPSAWKRRGILPCEIAAKLVDKGVARGLLIAASRGGHSMPPLLELDEDFLTFVGLWLGDGCYDKSATIISATDDQTREVVKRVGAKFGLPVNMHSDGWSLIIQSKVLKEVMKKALGFEGDAYTKAFPEWVHSLSDQQLACVLKGLYSSDGYTAAAEIGMSLASRELLWDIQTSLLRLGIISRLNRQSQDKTWSLRISSLESIQTFAAKVGFLRPDRSAWLHGQCSKKSTHDSTDIIPLPLPMMERLAKTLQLSRSDYVTRGYSIGRKKLAASLVSLQMDGGGKLMENLRELANGDVFWDEVTEVTREPFSGYVYDLSVPGCENFVCENFIAHNTLELPVVALRDLGFNVERLKSRSVITHLETELPAEEALRTALRLGDSALIIGEVRSVEAIALYEAMRIGALANVVAGTIHGESAYGVFDRVVHDLGVPPTSFKATDLILICNTLRSPDGLHMFRRITELTEVRKHWQNDPGIEGGFMPLLEYSATEDKLKPSRTLLMGESMILNDIANRVRDWKSNWEAVWDNINLRAKILQTLVDVGAAKPELLEAYNVVQSNSQFHTISDQVSSEVGFLDSKMIYERWLTWLRTKT